MCIRDSLCIVVEELNVFIGIFVFALAVHIRCVRDAKLNLSSTSSILLTQSSAVIVIII